MVEFTPYEIQLCLYDEERTKHFSKALKSFIKPDSIVVDAGSGTGVMGLLSAKYGASKVYCIELNQRFCKVIRENAKTNNFTDKLVIINKDATKVDLPEKVDVIIAEIISGGFFFEPQIQVINHLRAFLKRGGRVIPEKIETYLELISAQEELYGLKFNYDSRYVSLKDDAYTDKKLVFVADFKKYFSPNILSRVALKASKEGIVNAIRISYRIKLGEGMWIDKKTKFLLNPEILYLKKPLLVKKGKRYLVELDYTAADDTLDAKIRVNNEKLL